MTASAAPFFPYTNPAANMILGQLLTNDIADKHIFQAMEDIPREPFLPANLRGAAYVDGDLEIVTGRSLIAPLTFARLLDLANITPSCRVLNIGCLTGYTAAIIARLAGHVVAIDSDASVIEAARGHMQRLGIRNVNLQPVAAMQDGYAQSAPYDVIVISGAVHVISEMLGSQLSIGGRLVTVRNVASHPAFGGGLGKGLRVLRLDHKLQYREHFDASTPVLPGFESKEAFIF